MKGASVSLIYSRHTHIYTQVPFFSFGWGRLFQGQMKSRSCLLREEQSLIGIQTHTHIETAIVVMLYVQSSDSCKHFHFYKCQRYYILSLASHTTSSEKKWWLAIEIDTTMSCICTLKVVWQRPTHLHAAGNRSAFARLLSRMMYSNLTYQGQTASL